MQPIAAPRGRRWAQTLPASVPRLWGQWLCRPGSLTRALQTLGQVEVRIIHEGVACVPRRAAGQATIFAGPVWVRDVVLFIDEAAVITARSIASARDSRAVWRSLRTLQVQPLASLLYHDPAVTRTTFSYASFSLAREPSNNAERMRGDAVAVTAWARSSTFFRLGAPLCVTEIFMPQLWVKIAKSTDGIGDR